MLKLLTPDSNIFISETKGNEEYSDKCGDIISRVGSEFLLVEPAVHGLPHAIKNSAKKLE